MSNDPIFDIPYLDPNADQPEVVVNNMLDSLVARIAKRMLVGIDATNTRTITQDEQSRAGNFLIDVVSPGPSAAVTVNFNVAALGLIVIENQCGFSATLKITGQVGALPTLAYKAVGIFLHDGFTLRKLV